MILVEYSNEINDAGNGFEYFRHSAAFRGVLILQVI